MNCADRSDEDNCNFLGLGPNYSPQLPPRDVTRQPAVVYLNLEVLAFPAIDTVGLKYTADFVLTMRWQDFRLAMTDLNENSALNSLENADLHKIWTPRVSFLNALGTFQTQVDGLVNGEIIRESIPLPEDYTKATEGHHPDPVFYAVRNNAHKIYLLSSYAIFWTRKLNSNKTGILSGVCVQL